MKITNGTFKEEHVKILLQDISDKIEEQTTEEREYIIQNGGHYSEMLPIEPFPSMEEFSFFYTSLYRSAPKIAYMIMQMAKQIISNANGREIVLISMFRGGTPIGILLKLAIEKLNNTRIEHTDLKVEHYAVSIIRGKGIDIEAMKYISANSTESSYIQFVDGWTGKGTINSVLDNEIYRLNKEFGWNLVNNLAVLADPAGVAHIYGTRDDVFIPSSMFNAIVCGCLSRSVCNELTKDGFHGVKLYNDDFMGKNDMTYEFIDRISWWFSKQNTSKDIISMIMNNFNIDNVNLIKPSIGESMRVLLRRQPEFIIVSDEEDVELKELIKLARKKGVAIYEIPSFTVNYKAIAIIKNMEDI